MASENPDTKELPGAAPECDAPRPPTTGVPRASIWNSWLRRVATVRDVPRPWEAGLLGILSVLMVIVVWWFLTRPGHRLVDAYTLPTPAQTFRSLKSLWFERELSISAVTSLGRVLGGFLVAAAVAVPLGAVAGSYARVNAFLRPLSIFGRNVPVAALIPLTLIWFGLGEVQKVMFIFFSTVSFVLFDTTNAVLAVPDRYLDTSYTLGLHRTLKKGARIAGTIGVIYGLIAAVGWHWLGDSNRSLQSELASVGFWGRFLGAGLLGFCLWIPIEGHQVLRKVLLPLALPDIVNSLRLIFGVAFGYIMLAEVINARHGLGALIIISQRQGPREHIYLCLIIISLLAWGIDRAILRLQRHLFPYLKHGES